MDYGIQTTIREQLTLVVEEAMLLQKQRRSNIPIYRVALVKEGKIPCDETRIRRSVNAHAILQNYLADTD